MEDELVIFLILGSTIFALLVSFSEQKRNQRADLFRRILSWERLDESFARIFLTGLGIIVGSSLAKVISSVLGVENAELVFIITLPGVFFGAMIARWVIFEKMVAPQFRAMHEQETNKPPEEL